MEIVFLSTEHTSYSGSQIASVGLTVAHGRYFEDYAELILRRPREISQPVTTRPHVTSQIAEGIFTEASRSLVCVIEGRQNIRTLLTQSDRDRPESREQFKPESRANRCKIVAPQE